MELMQTTRLILIQSQCCGKFPCMAKKTDVPEFLPISPVTLVCPECHAKPGKDCVILPGGFVGIVHVSRIKAAAKLDHAKNARRK